MTESNPSEVAKKAGLGNESLKPLEHMSELTGFSERTIQNMHSKNKKRFDTLLTASKVMLQKMADGNEIQYNRFYRISTLDLIEEVLKRERVIAEKSAEWNASRRKGSK